MTEGLEIKQLHGREIEPWLDPLGALRIRVFHEYPYLYEGTLEHEREYLQVYVNSPRSLVVLAIDAQQRVVGATTCLPMTDEGRDFQKPFEDAGIALDDILYFGESILLPEYRGRGIGKIFFDLREAHAQRLGLHTTAFCAVDRPDKHPLRPLDYRPLDGFWQARGYAKNPQLQATFVWQEIGETCESPKTLTFWTRTCND